MNFPNSLCFLRSSAQWNASVLIPLESKSLSHTLACSGVVYFYIRRDMLFLPNTHVHCYGHNLENCLLQIKDYLSPCSRYLENDCLAHSFLNQLAYSSYLPKQYIFSSASESNFYSGGIWLYPQKCTINNISRHIICPCMSQRKKVSWTLNGVLHDCNSSCGVVDKKNKIQEQS